MGFFSRLFGLTKTSNTPTNAKPATTAKDEHGIKFDPTLFDKLKDDHQELLTIFGKISSAAEKSDFSTAQENLKKLKIGLQSHLVTENVRFYVYLQQNLAKDQQASTLIRDLKKEMDGIARVAVQFINKYETIVFTPAVAADFGKDLAKIGEVLVQRIKTEESSLYTLYQPNS